MSDGDALIDPAIDAAELSGGSHAAVDGAGVNGLPAHDAAESGGATWEQHPSTSIDGYGGDQQPATAYNGEIDPAAAQNSSSQSVAADPATYAAEDGSAAAADEDWTGYEDGQYREGDVTQDAGGTEGGAGGGGGAYAVAGEQEAYTEPEAVEAAAAVPEVTYHISSPGGVAPTSDAAHTTLSVNDEVPNFAGFSQLGRIEFHDYIAGGWSVLCTFARSFDPVSMTELGRLSKLMKNFKARSVNVLGVLQDSVLMLSNYLQDVANIEQCSVNFPVMADPDGAIARRLGAWDEERSTACSYVFVMGPFKKVRFRMTCQQDVGRNFYEVLRIIDALSVHSDVDCAAPSNWMYGEEVLISPWVEEAEYPRLFPKGVAKITKYYRTTPYPTSDL